MSSPWFDPTWRGGGSGGGGFSRAFGIAMGLAEVVEELCGFGGMWRARAPWCGPEANTLILGAVFIVDDGSPPAEDDVVAMRLDPL